MDFKVLITDTALNDLKNIVEFVAQDDPDVAARLGYKLVAAAMSLAPMPQRFPYYDRCAGIRKMPVPPFIIYYTCGPEPIVNILHFWHGARQTPQFNS